MLINIFGICSSYSENTFDTSQSVQKPQPGNIYIVKSIVLKVILKKT